MNALIVSISGGRPSKSHVLAEHAAREIAAADPGGSVGWIDFAENPLPAFGGDDTWNHPDVLATREQIGAANAIVIAAPIYNYTLPSSAKALIELTGEAWEDKVVGFVCTAGGTRSYMATLPFANTLMLDFRCLIVPRFVYATGDAFSPTNELKSAEVADRIGRFARDLVRLRSWYEAAPARSSLES